MNSCRECALWNPEALLSPPRERCEPDDIGECGWQPEGGLPESWRYCQSERMSTAATDGASCPQFRRVPA